MEYECCAWAKAMKERTSVVAFRHPLVHLLPSTTPTFGAVLSNTSGGTDATQVRSTGTTRWTRYFRRRRTCRMRHGMGPSLLQVAKLVRRREVALDGKRGRKLDEVPISHARVTHLVAGSSLWLSSSHVSVTPFLQSGENKLTDDVGLIYP